VPPQSFEIVISARLGGEDVNEEVAVIHEYPLRVSESFHADRILAELFELRADLFGDGLNLLRIVARAEDEKVGERGDLTQVQHADVNGFFRFGSSNCSEPGRRYGRERKGRNGDSLLLSNRLGSSPTLYATLKRRMRQLCVVFLALPAFACFGQVSEPSLSVPAGNAAASNAAAVEAADRRIELAKRDLTRITDLVQADALPRIRLDQARADLADAEDDAILVRTLYSPLPAVDQITDEWIDGMIAAAQRRVDREQARIDQSKQLIDKGFIPGSTIVEMLQELTRRSTTLELATFQGNLMRQMPALAQLERSIAETRVQAESAVSGGLMEHYEGTGTFNEARDLRPLERAFALEFDHQLPISANGETSLHRSLGFDHRGRVDVAVRPGDPEGVWLRQYLQAHKIPYYAFTQAVPGRATAAHIHIGPGSARLNGD